ncbi:nSTAND1 domain-containing NTPase [Chryseosolibacter indicus]|uniref:Novel STAND NTPase 1 domain-containing protein n=1 Tax=Chryseosolibacter indicus TaxID=2782351 RepID=A0ABS5VPU3_9BACT|nr:hypothetical protein [Chryseosolibacter indicus]MBT1703453.1 hypothetical protein [Chryseosolibacter indicus]
MVKQPSSTGEFENPFSDTSLDLVVRPGNPFPGLRPFSLDEAHLFFGREGHIDEILVKLAQHRFVAVMGYSGSGKSSLMYCGLVPVLYGGFMTQTGPHWTAILVRPGSSPIDNLAESIIDHLLLSKKLEIKNKREHKAIITSVLRSGPQGLVEVSQYIQSKSGENVFFLIDQFEELFRYKENLSVETQNEALLYVNLIHTAITQQEVPVYVALTMRSDFIGNCSAFPGLTQWINLSNYLVPQMTREQKKMVIQGPVAVAGGKISERLVTRLLSDIGNNQDQLPILQHALMRTWDYWVENRDPGEPIDLRHYKAIGRISEALSQHANETFDELSIRSKEIAEVLFKNTTEKGQDSKGMRRPAKLSLIAKLAEAEEEDVIEVVEHFRKAGRSFLMPPANVPLSGDSIIELSHESLMRIWKRLNVWVEEEFESAQMYKRLSEAAAMYQIGKTGLWRPPDLQLALNWQKKQRPTREWAQRYDDAFERAIVFLDTSRITYEAELKNQEMSQRRVLRRARATAVVLGIAFVVAILFFLLSYIQKIKADEQTRLAEKERQEAQVQRELAIKQKAEADRQRGLAQKAADDFAKSMSAVEDAFEVAQRERNRAEMALLKAKEEEQKASIAGKEEKLAEDQAVTQTRFAQQQFDRVNNLYMQALAQNLAFKSIHEDDDKELKGLLALQAYYFHTRYEGRKYDRYIYEGLYKALKRINGTTYSTIKTQGSQHTNNKSLAILSKDNSAFFTSDGDTRIMKADLNILSSGATAYSARYPGSIISLSTDEKYMVAAGDSSSIQIYALFTETRKPTRVVENAGGFTNDIKFIPNSTKFIFASADKTLSIGDVDGSSRKLVSFPTEIKRIAISPNGKMLAGASWDGQLYLVKLSTYEVEQIVLSDKGTRILSVNFTPDSNTLAYGTEDVSNKRGLIKLYNLTTKQTIQFTGHKAGVTDIEISADGKLLASLGFDKKLMLWLMESSEDSPITVNENNGVVFDIAFNNTSGHLIAACAESEIKIWPVDPVVIANQLCHKLTRTMTKGEWEKYVNKGEDIQQEPVCNK